MQKYSEVLSFEGYNEEQFALLVSLAMDSLQWSNHINDENEVEGQTKTSALSWGEKVIVKVYPNEAWITSRYQQWTLPVTPKNRQNAEALREEVIRLQEQYTTEQLDELRTKLKAEADHLLADLEKRYKSGNLEAGEKVALGLGGYYATYALSVIIVVVFTIMCIWGVSLLNPTAEDIEMWGGNFKPLTTDGEYWRLLSHQFVHIGIIHIVLNLYALFSIGVYLEPITGRWRFLLSFLLTGVVAGLVSIWWDGNRVSAGASGSIFGLYGFFLALLVTGAVGKEMKANLLTSVGIFIGANLMYGMKDNIDNAAHVGGLVSGFLGGLLFASELKWKKLAPALKATGIALPLIVTAVYLSAPHSKDQSFSMKLGEVAQLEQEALWPIASNENKSDNQLAGEMERISIPKWTEAQRILDHFKAKDLGTYNRKLHALLIEYTALRLRQAHLYIKKADDPVGFSQKELDSVMEQVNTKIETLNSMKPE